MKVYVDEMPKECAVCEFTYQEHSFDKQRCLFSGKHTSDNKQYCPFHSLTIHDEQVRADERKKVVEEIRLAMGGIEDILINCGNGKEDALCWINNILKQVEKGE